MIYLFNPSCEMAIRQGGLTYTPPRQIAQMERDMTPLVMFLGESGDHIIGHQPDEKFIEFWRPWIGERDFISSSEAAKLIAKGERFAPWGECRAVLNLVGQHDRARRWEWRNLMSRRSSVEVEKRVAGIMGVPSPAEPQTLEREEDAREWIETRSKSGDEIVIKSLWSASGRGVRFFHTESETDAVAAIIYALNCLRADGAVVVERKLERVAEFSFLFNVKEGRTTYEGVNRYMSAESGSMGWEVAGSQPHLFDVSSFEDEITMAAEALSTALGETYGAEGYEGPIGVDSMIFRDTDGALTLRPCMEVNARHCMGHVAKRLARHFSAGTPIKWRMERFADSASWMAFCEEQTRLYPIEKDEFGFIKSGFFRLTGIDDGSRFGAFGWAGSEGMVND